MTVNEIVKKYMEENGYDGLTDDEDCACFLDDGFMDNSLICPLHCQAIHREDVKKELEE